MMTGNLTPNTGDMNEFQFAEFNAPLLSTIDLIVGRDGVRDQEFLELGRWRPVPT